MKKAFFILFTILSLLVIGCANEADSKNNNDGNTDIVDSTTEYTLTFMENFPEVTDEVTYGSNSLADVDFPKPIKATKSTSITIPNCWYTYTLRSRVDYTALSNIFYFSHWNTNSDNSGTSYEVGQVITLTEDMTLYAIYVEEADNDDSGDDNENVDDSNILDIATTTSFSMKVGQTVTLKPSWSSGDDCTYTITSNDDGAVSLSGKVITALNIGTAIIKMQSNQSSSSGSCVISVTSEGFEGKVIENKLLGTWVYTGSSSNGTIILNSDKTGHITAYLTSSKVHDNDFTWSAYENKSGSTTYHYLTIKGTGVDSLDGDHQITNLYSTRFTLKGYLAFGMPSETTWYKQ